MAVEVIRRKKQATRKVWEFALEFYEGDNAVVHQFKAYPSMDAGGLSYTLSATHKPERAIEGLVRSIRKMLADDDGTPANYRPTRYTEQDDGEPENAEPLDDTLPEDAEPHIEYDTEDLAEDADLLFADPEGKPITGQEVADLLTFDAGSSRRRFSYLMDEDDTLTLEIDQLQNVYRKLLARAADRPTRR